LGARITENGVPDRKIWLWIIWRAKWSFHKVLGGAIHGIFEWMEALA
jgi:hypothetical protein